MTTINATAARNNFFKLIDETLTTHIPVTVTGKSGNVVILSEEDFSAIQETLYLTSIPGMRDKLLKGFSISLDDCVEDS